MTKNLTRSMIAAGLALSTAAIYAQTVTLTAKVPFAFTAMGKTLTPGKYAIVSGASNAAILRIQNYATGEGSNVGIGIPSMGSSGKPRLVFKCTDQCALSEVWHEDGRGYKFWTPRVKPSQLERVAVIYLDRKNGD